MQFDLTVDSITPDLTVLTVAGNGGLVVPSGVTGNRPTATNGTIRYNTGTLQNEFVQGGGWVNYLPVVITSPVTSQTVTYNGTVWVNSSISAGNASGLIGPGFSGGGTAWTQVGVTTRYTANFVHNLGTQNVVITVYNTADNSVVIPDKVVATSGTTVTITVVGNTLTLRVVVVANGSAIAAGGSTPSSVITSMNGVTVGAAETKLNFTGNTSVTSDGAGTTTISIGARYTNFANSFDTPNNGDWAINAFAATITDPTYPAMNMRSFSNTVEQGVGFYVSIPTGATVANFRLRGRASATLAASVVAMRVYYRSIPNNGAPSAWVGPLDLGNIAIPGNQTFQYFTQSASLATAGLIPGTTYQFELTRRVAGVTGTNLAANFLLAESTFEFL